MKYDIYFGKKRLAQDVPLNELFETLRKLKRDVMGKRLEVHRDGGRVSWY